MYLFIYPVEIQIKSDMQCWDVWFCLDRIEAVRHVGELYLICCYVKRRIQRMSWGPVTDHQREPQLHEDVPLPRIQWHFELIIDNYVSIFH